MQVMMIVIASLLCALALTGTTLVSPSNYDKTAMVDSVAPEAAYYGNVANMNTVTAMRMANYKLVNIEQSLVDICRASYTMAQANSCSSVNESVTWAFLFQNGNTGTLNSVLSAPSSSTFTCAHPEQYGTYLLQSVYSDLTGFNFNLNIYNSTTQTTAPVSGQPDPCAYADIVATH